MADHVKKIKQVRAGHRAATTKRINEAEEILKKYDRSKENALEAIRTELIEKLEKLKDLNEEILDGIVETEVTEDKDSENAAIENEIENASVFTTKIHKCLHSIGKAMSLRDSADTASLLSATSGNLGQRVKLPKIELAKFNGDPKSFQAWWDTFDSLINQNDLSDVDKFHYLRSVLTGDALSAVAGLTPSSGNYKHAIDIIKERFGKRVLIISSHMDSILKIPWLTEGDTTQKLRRAYDNLETHIKCLQSLGIESQQYGCLLVPVILNHLPNELKLLVSRKFDTSKDIWELDELLKILKEEIEARERSGYVSAGKKQSSNRGEFHKEKGTASTLFTRNEGKGSHAKLSCVYCKGKHSSGACKTLCDVDTRKLYLKNSSRCFNCLSDGHVAWKCRSKDRCKKCNRKHHSSICENGENSESETKREVRFNESAEVRESESTESKNESASSMYCNSVTSVLMLTARANVRNTNRLGSVNARIIFDNCSSKTYVTKRLKKGLNLKPIGSSRIAVNRFMDEQSEPLNLNCDIVQVEVMGIDGSSVTITASAVPSICPPPHSKAIVFYKQEYEHLSGLPLADEVLEEPFAGDEIDIMIGLDYYYTFVFDESKRGVDGPVATKTRLGWIVGGPVISNECANLTMHAGVMETESSDEFVSQLWSLEGLGIEEECERDVMDRFTESVWFNDESGRYQVSLPWREGIGPLSDNFGQSFQRLRNLCNRFVKDPELYDEYEAVMSDQIEQGVLERVPAVPPAVGDSYYLPHHPVVRRDHASTKVRIVFDASSKIVGPSLNSALHEGPSLIAELFQILMRFRLHKVAVIADIEKAFLNIEINELDRDFLRCLWLEGFDPRQTGCLDSLKVQVFRFTRVPFGICSSPFHLGATLRFHVDKYKETCPKTVEALNRDLYVDNLISGSDTVEGGLKLFIQARDVLKQGGFNLRQFSTNSPELKRLVETIVYEMPDTGYPTYSEVIETSIETPLSISEEKVLGVVWNKEADTFIFRFEKLLEFVKDKEITKRFLMRLIARVYDPLGLICPLMVSLKCALREVCELGVSWDERLPGKYVKLVRNWLENIENVGSIEFPRCLSKHELNDLISSQLIAFSDASEIAFGGTIYLRTETTEGIDSNLLVAKSRVAPKGQTLPRKELIGALQIAKLFDVARKVVTPVLSIDNEFYFSDSKTALSWIRNKEGRFKQFVERRAKTIRETTESSAWKHVKGVENPADIATRAISLSELKSSERWRKGPDWLRQPISEWPTDDAYPLTEEYLQELRADDKRKILETSMLANDKNTECPIKAERYSSLSKLLRVTAYVFRFINNCRKTLDSRHGEMQVKELQDAENYWITLSQNKLKSDRKFGQIYKQLRIYQDDEDILRAKGRLENSNLSLNQKVPIVLPAEGYFIELLVSDAHLRTMHGGVNDTMAFLRNRFWILRLRQITRRLVNKCFVCKLIEGKAYSGRPFPPLPKFRVLIDEPFSTSGTDYAGPLFVKTVPMEAKKGKVYILLFTCTSTRAVHLELVKDLGAPSCILGLRRFIARRGAPKLVISDNAKTFKAEETKRFLSDRGISWKFNLPRAPWTGGIFERMIKSTKRCLKKVIRNSSLTYDELETVLIEAENIINNRPLSYIDTDTTEEIITPNHLIFGRSLPIASNESSQIPIDSRNRSFKRRVLYRQKVLRDFRNRWKKEYLVNLRQSERVSGTKQIRSPKVGDVVLIQGDCPRLQWKLGRIVGLIDSEDGICRGAEVIVSGTKNIVKRSIKTLYPLEENSSLQNQEETLDSELDSEQNDDLDINDQTDETPVVNIDGGTKRSRRVAAIDADFRRRILKQK